MLGIIIVLLLLIITGVIVLAYEIADIHKCIRDLDRDILGLDVRANNHFLDMQKKLNGLREEVAGINVQPKLSEDSDDFSKRIEDIKNELGLRVQIADAQKNIAPTLHPSVYNIDAKDQDAYEIKQEVEYAR